MKYQLNNFLQVIESFGYFHPEDNIQVIKVDEQAKTYDVVKTSEPRMVMMGIAADELERRTING